jgi:hypothetical protein
MKQDSMGRSALIALAVAAALTGCGGGGGGSDGATAPVTLGGTPGDTTATTVPGTGSTPAAASSDLAPACSNCAAVSPTSYAGSGVGIWQKTNSSGAAMDVNVAITGLAGQDVTLVFTNPTATDAALPAINTTASASYAQELRKDVIGEPGATAQDEIREFNREGWHRRLQDARTEAAIKGLQRSAVPQAATVHAVGATRNFYHMDKSTRTARLQKQLTAGDGTVVNVWVETTEIADTKVSTAISDQLATSFARAGGIYDMLKSVGGPLWGAHGYPELISGSGQPLDIVVLNFDRNQQPYGMVGFYWSLHQFTKAADARSNESVSMYLDSETMYLGGARGLQTARMTLAHEGMHMSNFYRRGISMGQAYQFDTWLEEMTAMMMEDAAASSIDASYQPLRDQRLRDYLGYGSYNCALRNWTPYAGSCESYAVSGSFGGFLLRHLGVGFFRDLLARKQAGSETVLGAAIQAVRPDSGIGAQLQSFAASAIGTLPASAPAGYGFPARSEAGFDIPAVDASAFAGSRVLPSGSPSTLLSYANFPVARKAVNGTYAEKVRVPAGATLSVVVH